jgi:RNA polymerase sigma-70 factor (family 1)
MDDSQILEGLRNRDLTAFEQLYDSLAELVLYYTEQITKDKIEAEDITVHSFSKFWEQDLSEFDSIKSVRSFIFKVAKNSAFDYLRKQKVKHSHQRNISYLTEQQQEEYIMEGSRYRVELIQKVYQEIDKLPKRTQEVFKMVYVQEMSTKEVGEQLNISVVTVRRLCSDAIQKLRNKFSEKDLQLILLLLSLRELEKAGLLSSTYFN